MARGVVPLLGLVDLVDRRADGRLVGLGELVLVLVEQLLELVDPLIGGVAGLGQVALPLVLGGVRLGVALHPLDLVLREAARGLDLDRLLLARPLVTGGDVEDAVGVDVERHLDLRRPHPRGRDALEVELAEQPVVGGHRPLALVDLDRDGRLVVLGGGEGLLLLGRDRRVPLDQLGEDAPLGLQAERQRGDVEQQQVLDLAGQDRPLDRGADGDDLVGVDPLVRLLAEDLLDDLLDPRHPGRAADQHDLVDVRPP